ncbi:hypothetical protein A2Z33_04680 [Candidatus Gottesmanbacteria bacterium RBG_16_52_11]|uniref:Glycosyl transferase family 1 domain-containing protein n=1 Tax=Candidatus Gottesmanbacteria bacterium RBG_16_52_11 TaxID=1798374 RepID=A0A1F5YUG1_9BACT|nr:MAG: hypothetical protein A2Z33_04680 [Candidatus Gottesmanbacteria bacterium RBG_16_52_11]
MKTRLAIVRGAFLNRYEMQFYEPLVKRYDITAFSSLKPFHDVFSFPVIRLPSPVDLPVFPLKMQVLNRLFIDAHYLYGLEEYLRNFDIVHTAETYFYYTQQCLDARDRGYVRRVVTTVLETIPFNNESIPGRSAFKSRTREEADHLIALTDKTRLSLIAEGADPGKISVIRHYVDTGLFAPEPAARRRVGGKSAATVILYCGRLENYKGVTDIIDAAVMLLGSRSLAKYRISFRFVGDGSLKQALLKSVGSLGLTNRVTVEKADYRQMPQIYRQASIYVAPSKPTDTWEEQYNTTLLEAQASGLPIVTTISGGIPENVGDAAVLIPPGDPAALTRALTGFVKDPYLRERYGRRARKRAVAVHDISIGAGLLDCLYRKLLS